MEKSPNLSLFLFNSVILIQNTVKHSIHVWRWVWSGDQMDDPHIVHERMTVSRWEMAALGETTASPSSSWVRDLNIATCSAQPLCKCAKQQPTLFVAIEKRQEMCGSGVPSLAGMARCFIGAVNEPSQRFTVPG